MSTTIALKPLAVSSSLVPYAGPWTHQQAAHLLRRCCFGPTREEIQTTISAGMDDAVANLLQDIPLPAPPVNHYFPDDPNVPIGSTWVEAPFVDGVDVGPYRWGSLRGWIYDSLQEGGMNIREKMLLFWNNHFGMADMGDHRVQYQYVQLFRQYATGNFKQLIKDITIHPSMLRFLNGEYSNKWSPNENYARELVELFTVGKGVEDDTNYSQQDIDVMSRILTGWRNANMWSTNNEMPHSYFFPNWHDDDDSIPKQLSHHFDNALIMSNGADEYADLIDVIFQKEEVALFICRKLYRYFVYYKIDDTIETDIIVPLAQIMRDNDYELQPVLSALLKSQHFYEIQKAGDVIKNPIEFIMSFVRPLGWGRDNFPLKLRYDSGRALHWWASQLDMDFFYPPSVSGWKAWYLQPSFNRLWLNSSTLQQRTSLTNGAGWSGIWVDGEGRPFDWFGFIAGLTNPFDPNALVLEVSEIFLPQALHQTQLDELKNQLIPDLPDFEWTDEYGMFLSGDESLRTSVENKIKSLFRALFRMAEFHLN